MSLAEGKANTKYAEKKLNWISMTSTYLRSKIALRCGTRMSFKLVRKPHMKNRRVTIASAPRLAEVSGAFARTDGVSVIVSVDRVAPLLSATRSRLCPLARNRSGWDTPTRFPHTAVFECRNLEPCLHHLSGVRPDGYTIRAGVNGEAHVGA